MEKSMIQDLDGMRVSLGSKNTFTTSFHDGGYQLRKSKISNLPSHKKSDLSVNLPFVIIFQAIQIERLSEQIEALRIALKDSERQAFNCQSYQVQIRELTDKCHEYDVELLEYKQEIQKLNMISQKLLQQLEQWKEKYQNFDSIISQKYNVKVQQCLNLQNQISKCRDRYRALQKSKDRQMQQLKLAMQSQRKSVIDRQIKQLSIKFDCERNYLQDQIKKIQQALDQRDDELRRIKFQAQTLRIQNEVNLDASRKLKQSENKVKKNTEQVVRINQLLRRKNQQISRKDQNEQYLKHLIKTLQSQKINRQNQAIKVPQLEGCIKQWTVRYSRLENQSNKNKQLLQKLPILQQNIQNSLSEIQKLNLILKSKLAQINELNTKIDKYRQLYEESKKYQQKFGTLERRIKQMNYQAERYNNIIKKRLIEIQQYKNRIINLEKALRIFEQAQPKKRKTQEQLKKQVREVQNYKRQIQQLQKQIRKIPQLEAVLADQRNIRQQYIKEVERLNSLAKDQSKQNQTLAQKVFHLETKLSQLTNIDQQLKYYKNKNNKLRQQLDKLQNRIKQKSQQLQNLIKIVHSLQQNSYQYKIIQFQLIENISNTQKVIIELNNTKSQLQNAQNTLLQYQNQLTQAKNIIIQINNDKQIINKILNIKIQQIQQNNCEINQYAKQIQQLRQIQRCYCMLQEDIRLLENRYKEIQQCWKQQKENNSELFFKNQILDNQIEKIRLNGYFPEQFRCMFQQIKMNARQKQKQIDNLVRKQVGMQKFMDEILGILTNIYGNVKVRNCYWVQINNKITQSFNNWNKIIEMQQQMNNLSKQNLELESQIKILNLQILQSQVRKSNSNQTAINMSMSNTSSTSWSFNTVPSKKTIYPISQYQKSSMISSISNNKQVLSSTENIVMNNTISKSKYEDEKSSKISDYKSNIEINQLINKQANNNQSSVSFNSSRGVSFQSNLINFVSPSKMSSNFKQSKQTYFMNKLMKTSSVKEPFTFKSAAYRS